MGLPPEVLHLGYSLLRDAITTATIRKAECSCHCPSTVPVVEASCAALEHIVERHLSDPSEPDARDVALAAIVIGAFSLGCFVGTILARRPHAQRVAEDAKVSVVVEESDSPPSPPSVSVAPVGMGRGRGAFVRA